MPPSPEKQPDRNGTVLVVEDDEAILMIVETLLKKQGYRVSTATDGKMAQDLLRKPPAQLSAILLDWQMPKMTGIELLRWIKKTPTLESLPVIMVTGMTTKQHVREGIDAGAFYYITKPFDNQMLTSVVHAAVTDFQYKQMLVRRLQESENPFHSLVEGTFRVRTIEEGERIVLWIANASTSPQKATQLSEIVMNAVEHGNLGVGYEEKTRLLATDTWHEEIQRRLSLPANAQKYVDIQIKKQPDKITALVTDQGLGFDYKKYLHFDEGRVFDTHGRGIAMASVALDVEFLEKGNKVMVTIRLK